MNPIAKRINDQMETLGLTVNSLAATTKIPRTTLQRRLSDPSDMTLKEVERIATALGINKYDLLSSDAA